MFAPFPRAKRHPPPHVTDSAHRRPNRVRQEGTTRRATCAEPITSLGDRWHATRLSGSQPTTPSQARKPPLVAHRGSRDGSISFVGAPSSMPPQPRLVPSETQLPEDNGQKLLNWHGGNPAAPSLCLAMTTAQRGNLAESDDDQQRAVTELQVQTWDEKLCCHAQTRQSAASVAGFFLRTTPRPRSSSFALAMKPRSILPHAPHDSATSADVPSVHQVKSSTKSLREDLGLRFTVEELPHES